MSGFDPLIQRLEHAGVHRGDDIHRRIELFFRHASFPCVRKAPFYSRVAKPYHRYRQPHEHFFPLAQAGRRMRISIKPAKISLCHLSASMSILSKPNCDYHS